MARKPKKPFKRKMFFLIVVFLLFFAPDIAMELLNYLTDSSVSELESLQDMPENPNGNSFQRMKRKTLRAMAYIKRKIMKR